MLRRVVADEIAPPDPLHNFNVLTLTILRCEDCDRLADNLLRTVAKQFLHAVIAGSDPTLAVNAYDGIVRRLHNRRNPLGMPLPQRVDSCPKILWDVIRWAAEQTGFFRLTALGVSLVHHPHARASRTASLSLC